MKTPSNRKVAREAKKTDDPVTRARELAWAGQHAQVIELISEVLEKAKVRPGLQVDPKGPYQLKEKMVKAQFFSLPVETKE